MQVKVRGIVLQTTPYRESSIIAAIFTDQLGLQSYLVNGVRKKGSKFPASIFHPLAVVEMVVYHSNKAGLKRIADIQVLQHLHGITTHPIKSSIAIFLHELLHKILKEEEPDLQLFDFLISSIGILEVQEPINSSFHLQFMVQLTRYLGFFPHGEIADNLFYFDLQEGVFKESVPLHPLYLEGSAAVILQLCARYPLSMPIPQLLNKSEKKNFLESLLLFFQMHRHHFGTINSLKVLDEIWN
ncbi:MAG: repair protein RecO [Bacteroidota bacterium]|jgi:DNA repair protein RecO (recombination protein O)